MHQAAEMLIGNQTKKFANNVALEKSSNQLVGLDLEGLPLRIHHNNFKSQLPARAAISLSLAR